MANRNDIEGGPSKPVYIINNAVPIDGTSGFYLLDTDGKPFGLTQVENRPRITSVPCLYDVARGIVPSCVPWVKIGYNGDIGNTEEDVWTVGGIYTWPTGAMGMEVVSTDNTNDKAGGTGALTVTISYLDANYIEKSDTVTLNGTTAVPTTATDIFRVQNFRVSSTGTSGHAAGTISLRHLSDTPIYSQIQANYTRASNICWTVPAGKTLYVTSITMAAGSTVTGRHVRMTTRATYDNTTGTNLTPGIFFIPFTEIIVQDNSVVKPLEVPTKLPSGVDLKVSAISPEGAAVASCVLRGWLETD